MYQNMNDYELLYMISEKNDDFNILYLKYQPLIYKIVKNYQKLFKKFGYELDDLMQIGYLTLYKSSYLYDSLNNAMFYTYFKKALTNAIIMEIRNNSTNKKEVLNKAFSYDTIVPNTEHTYLELFTDTSSRDYREEMYQFIIFKNTLSFFDACIFELLYNGFHNNEISLLLRKDKETINKSILDIRRQSLTQKGLFF